MPSHFLRRPADSSSYPLCPSWFIPPRPARAQWNNRGTMSAPKAYVFRPRRANIVPSISDFLSRAARTTQSGSLFRFRVSCRFRISKVRISDLLRAASVNLCDLRGSIAGSGARRGRKLKSAGDSWVTIPLAERLFFQAFRANIVTRSGETFITKNISSS
jgi:hypothetical protein